MTVDLLAFGAHPDDVEIGAGGTLIKHQKSGHKVAIIDLTAGEMGSNGTAEIRAEEAIRAGEIIGVEFRKCLELPDSKIKVEDRAIKLVVEEIRKHRPKVVLAPYWHDRHPDHENSSRLIAESCFKAGLKKFKAKGEPYRPEAVVYYFLARVDEPDFVVDISNEYERKMDALFAHESQVKKSKEYNFKTALNDSDFIGRLDAKFRYFGYLINTQVGEGFKYKKTIEISDMTMLKGGV
ncbi:bacillithiol biosynthesis deacetylase BshB1 [Selenihalanaerobacter shriftii]|nr:bacillithiol biosynthesis deacetylase BshB1 [Selenihalanaerobacter shriftii]